MSLLNLAERLKGSAGSGNWGHGLSNRGGLSAIGSYYGSTPEERKREADKKKKKARRKKGGFNNRKHR